MPFIDLAGARLHWRTDGADDKPALLLGNSLSTDTGVWDAVLPALVQHFRVIRFDNRGHGQSALLPGSRGTEYSIEMLARDALAVADAAGAQRFSYLGISIGGMVGLWLGAHAPERLDRLVLSNTAAQMPAGVWAQRIAEVRAGGVATQVDSTMERWFTAAWRERAENRGTLERTRATFLAVDVDGYLGCAAAVRDMDLLDALDAIDVPTLVVTGAFDPSTPPALGQEIATRIPGALCTELQAAHMPPVEQPQEYVGAVLGFLRGDA